MSGNPAVQVLEPEDGVDRPALVVKVGGSEHSGRGSRRSDTSPRPGTPSVSEVCLMRVIVDK